MRRVTYGLNVVKSLMLASMKKTLGWVYARRYVRINTNVATKSPGKQVSVIVLPYHKTRILRRRVPQGMHWLLIKIWIELSAKWLWMDILRWVSHSQRKWREPPAWPQKGNTYELNVRVNRSHMHAWSPHTMSQVQKSTILVKTVVFLECFNKTSHTWLKPHQDKRTTINPCSTTGRRWKKGLRDSYFSS